MKDKSKPSKQPKKRHKHKKFKVAGFSKFSYNDPTRNTRAVLQDDLRERINELGVD